MTTEEIVTREEFEALKKDLEDLKAGKIVKKPKVKRAPSEYNKFMSEKMLELKSKNKDMDRKEVFKKAVEAWKKNKK